MTTRTKIACLGAGRMGRGIAVAFAYAGHSVTMVDVKARSAEEFARLEADALREVRKTFASLSSLGLLTAADVEPLIARVSVVASHRSAAALADAGMVFEGVPEVVELKREVLGSASRQVRPDAIIASTTSTILVDDLSDAIENPRRFLNVHWLNPAYLIPLVEISPGKATDPAVLEEVKALLEGIGKVPVVCAATPGFIVPRIQALAMNEAARMVEEGVASAEEIDKAIRYGFGFRYAVLGLLALRRARQALWSFPSSAGQNDPGCNGRQIRSRRSRTGSCQRRRESRCRWYRAGRTSTAPHNARPGSCRSRHATRRRPRDHP